MNEAPQISLESSLGGIREIVGSELGSNFFKAASTFTQHLESGEDLVTYFRCEYFGRLGAPHEAAVAMTNRRLIAVDEQSVKLVMDAPLDEVARQIHGKRALSRAATAAFSTAGRFNFWLPFENKSQKVQQSWLPNEQIRILQALRYEPLIKVMGDIEFVDPGSLPVATLFDLGLYERYIMSEGHKLHPLEHGVSAEVASDGNVSSVRGRNLAQKFAGGLVVPFGWMFFGNAKVEHHDFRETVLVLESRDWVLVRSYANAFRPLAHLFAKASERAAPVNGTSIHTPTSAEADVVVRLRELSTLRSEGMLTDDEFALAKARVLDGN